MKLILISFIAGVLIISAATGIFVFTSKLQPVSELKEIPTVFSIPKGAGFRDIANELYSKKLIQSKIVFEIYALIKGSAHRLQNGKYKFNSAVSIPELVDILTIGPKDISVVIFPGMTLKEIDDRLSGENIIKKGELTNYENGVISLEGFLLPDTYNFRQDSDINLVVRRILDNFESKAMPIIEGGLGVDPAPFMDCFSKNALGVDIHKRCGVDKKIDSVLKLIIIASYLEKEVPDNNERKIVAGIIEKRLKVGMPLQIDATVLYNKCLGRFIGCPLLRREDFKIDSAHNTYLRLGLTPTPISNPSLDAIKSAIEKKESPYWYYISDPKTKKTIFAENLEKHNINRAKYLLNNK